MENVTFKTNIFKEIMTDWPLPWTKFYILTPLCNWIWHSCIKQRLYHQAIYSVLFKNQIEYEIWKSQLILNLFISRNANILKEVKYEPGLKACIRGFQMVNHWHFNLCKFFSSNFLWTKQLSWQLVSVCGLCECRVKLAEV